MNWPPPLRFILPLALLLFAGAAGAVTMLYGKRAEERSVEDRMRIHAQFFGTKLSAMCAYLMESLSPSSAQREIALTAVDRDLRLTLVVNHADEVLFSTRYDLIGKPLAATPLASQRDLVGRARSARAGEVRFSGDRLSLYGAFPFAITPRFGGAPRDADYGMVLLDFDLHDRRAALAAQHTHRLWVGGSVLLGLTGVFWLIFGSMLTQRVDRLTQAAHQLAAGDLSARSGLTGSDEFAHLGRTFDQMAADLQHHNRERERVESERTELERKFQETQKLESLGVLAGGIAHDFNNLLTGVLGNASLARQELEASSPAHPHIEQIEAVTLRAGELCKQMLAYSGKGRFQVQRLDLSALVRETTQLVQLSIDKTAVLRFNLAEGLPPVEADATQMRQVIMNLVINAGEALGGKSGVITINTGLVRADRGYLDQAVLSPELPEGDYAYLEVSDNGCGMTPEQQARIFEPFFTTKFTGRGLGLSAVLGIVRGHRGAMRVYSEQGKGTTFKVVLPTASGTAEALPVEQAAEAWTGSGMVLVVDDEQTVRTVAARMVEKCGFTAITANNGQEGVEKFKAHRDEIVVILMDLTMPHLDGESAFRELRALAPEVRVILMSGFNEQDAINRFTGKGLAGFIQKPFRPDALRRKLKEVLEPA